MSDIPQGSLNRSAKLASLPISAAGRATKGFGQRLLGKDRAEISAEMQRRTAEQLFEVLGTLKGGAMKFGQALSVFEAALPEEAAAPYRAALTKLQNSAPPMDGATVRSIMAEQLGTGWPQYFRDFDDTAAAAASIGQVHRAIWRDGRDVAVKLQYPGAAQALTADMNQLSRLSRLMTPLLPGIEVKPLMAELKVRILEEIDYAAEAANQRAFAAAYADDPEIYVGKIVASAPKLIVSEWVEGRGFASIIESGTPEERNLAGRLMSELHFSAPTRVHLLHSDPHPGNYILRDDGRLGVIDFGSIAPMPNGSPPIIGTLARLSIQGDAERLVTGLRAEGFIPANFDPDPDVLMAYLVPYVEPLRHEIFHFTRAWMQELGARMSDFSSAEVKMARRLNLPPSYLMIQRVTLGSIGVLCQLDARAPFRDIVARWQPGFAQDPA
ncbi:AarF/ABC1/UbiB kinase family protein [Nakamurella antarctica]|uniref:AarF/ABC1/UbiB kinase family protein n=1 Tax=Nakamurella antarctica TaxID=1902245 RepID=A0A3G8ZXN1_9ACTN|nr:AarF/ABC1/UbiB kinase family protein [Nakamurella antarctica]AZI58401.1 AarF/ABC1/UbiB kinase family protein [Nakamurella antarctica]